MFKAARRTAACGLLALLAVAGCTVGPSDRPPVAVRGAGGPAEVTQPPQPHEPPAPAPPGRFDPASLPWEDCTGAVTAQLGGIVPPRVDCAKLRVATDLEVPALGGALQLDVTKVGAGPAPLVVVGEAGGEPGTLRAARIAAQAPPGLLDAYTLIGLGRRGTSPGDPIQCISEFDRQRLLGTDPAALEAGEIEPLLDVARTAIQTCVQDLGQLLTVLDSTSTADDLEQLRVVLDAPTLNILALGEASRSVVHFLDRYPTSSARVVMDGALDPTVDGIGAAEAAAQAAESGFNAFARSCGAGGCPLGPDPRATVTELRNRLTQAPLQSGSVTVTAGIATQVLLQVLGEPGRWGELAQALGAALAGDGGPLAALAAPVLTGSEARPALFDPDFATNCNDDPTRVPPMRSKQLIDEWKGRYPLFGTVAVQRLLLCSAWPVPSAPREGGGSGTAPPLLVIATEGDPVVSAQGSRRMADQLPSAILINWQGSGHGAYGRTPCVTDVIMRYLVDSQLPTPSTLCPP